MKIKQKIFISSYACEPNLGSEIGVGWHWVLEMSKYFDLWVLTRKSNQKTIEAWMAQQVNPPNIHFIYFDLPPWAKFWKKGLSGVRTYYILWQLFSNALVKKIMQTENIDIYHHLTYGNALWPIGKYGQKKFFVWGPTGAGDVIPSEYSKHYNFKGRVLALIRRASVKTLPINCGFRSRCKNANLILCKTDLTKDSIPKKYRHKAIVFTDVAVEKLDVAKYSSQKKDTSVTKYLAVGRLDAWRGFDLLLEAFHLALIKNKNIELEILGKGADYNRLTRIIERLNLGNNVRLTGQVSMKEYYEKMASSDVIVNPCLKEGAVTTAFDSMSFAKPLICLETGGYTRYFNNDYAIVIPITRRKEVISALAEGMSLLTKEEEREKRGKLALEKSTEFSWEKKGLAIFNIINTTYNNRY
jgi:glycosyltransferase involved in cell wall biosynthesis